jgi:hypothetical protein
MNINKSSSYVLIHLLNGQDTAAKIDGLMPTVDIRSIQRSLVRLTELGIITRNGTNNPVYTINYPVLISTAVPDKLLEDDGRPVSRFNRELMVWLNELSIDELDNLFTDQGLTSNITISHDTITAKELEYLTIELAWKSSSLEGNTYTLLDTQLLLVEGIKAKNKTEFETQMILNHKNAISFIVDHKDSFSDKIEYRTVEHLHGIIGYNLGIDGGIRKRLVRISASKYEPLSNPHQLKESMETTLDVINKARSPYVKALLALLLIPYLQAFEDGNKRTGRMLANAILIHSIGRGFSLRKVDAKQLALAYLAFYEFNSALALSKILSAELT